MPFPHPFVGETYGAGIRARKAEIKEMAHDYVSSYLSAKRMSVGAGVDVPTSSMNSRAADDGEPTSVQREPESATP